MTRTRLVLICAALALAACTRADKAPSPEVPKPTAEFIALDTRGRNLLVYDAFCKQLESNYYDPKYFATTAWRTLRSQWREKAANTGGLPFTLHNDVLREVIKLMPESHFATEYPRVSPDQKKTEVSAKAQADGELFTRLFPLTQVGPGLATTEVRRGNHLYNLVSDVWKGTLADEHGIRPGWRVLSSHWTLKGGEDAVHYVGDFVPLNAAGAAAWERGDIADTPVLSTDIVHVRFDLRDGDVRMPFETRELAGGVRYVRFDGFGDEAFMQPVFDAIDKAGPPGLVLDLRWNSGGSSDAQMLLSGVLLGDGAFLGTMQDRKGVTERRATHYERHYTGPLVILVGPVSASASEITAAAVQDHKRGHVLGRRTNGSVLSSRYFPLPDGGSVQVPIENYFRAGGRRIEGAGVEPDVWILPTLEAVRAGRDPVLERALEELGAAPAL